MVGRHDCCLWLDCWCARYNPASISSSNVSTLLGQGGGQFVALTGSNFGPTSGYAVVGAYGRYTAAGCIVIVAHTQVTPTCVNNLTHGFFFRGASSRGVVVGIALAWLRNHRQCSFALVEYWSAVEGDGVHVGGTTWGLE
jgi:hypothetical protein